MTSTIIFDHRQPETSDQPVYIVDEAAVVRLWLSSLVAGVLGALSSLRVWRSIRRRGEGSL